MLVNKNKCRISFLELLLTLVSVLYLVGIRFWFPVCEVMSDTPMRCHWAGEMLKAASVVLTVLSVLHLFVYDEKIKIGMDAGLAGLSLLMLLIPGRIILLCTNAEMHCRHNTEPWTITFVIVTMLLCAADILFYLYRQNAGRHKRKGTEQRKSL